VLKNPLIPESDGELRSRPDRCSETCYKYQPQRSSSQSFHMDTQ